MSPQLVLFVGTRGIRIADTVRPLVAMTDPAVRVTVVTSQDILDERSDSLADAGGLLAAVIASTRDGMLAAARAHAERHQVAGALTFSDDLVDLTSVFAAEHGLPGQDPATIDRFRDKFVQRSTLAKAGVPVPPFHQLCTADDIEDALAAVPLPAILKPTRGSGGALAYVITSPEELRIALAESLAQAPGVGGAVERDTAFLLEGFLVGSRWHRLEGIAPYVSVETVAAAGRYTHLAVTDRFPTAPPTLETGMVLPSSLSPAQRAEIVVMAERALAALEFTQGLAHTELMLTADGPRIIEVNARAGGALPYLFPMVSDVDLIEQAGRVALGLDPVEWANFHGHAVFVAPQHPVGVEVREVAGLADVAALPQVRAVIPLALGGTRTDGFRNTLMAAILATVETPEQAVALYAQVMAAIRPDYAPA